MKLKNNKKNRIILNIFIIFLICFLNINYIGRRLNSKIDIYVERITMKQVKKYLFYDFSRDLLTNEEFNKIINFDKNSEGEIIRVNYNMPLCYSLLTDSMDKLFRDLSDLKMDSKYYIEDKKLFLVPLGYSTDNVLISNFGPKIPIKVDLLNNVRIGFKTKVKNYGINNALVEIYLNVEAKSSIINPISEREFGDSYEILVASSVVTGKIPNYYGGFIEESSAIVTS